MVTRYRCVQSVLAPFCAYLRKGPIEIPRDIARKVPGTATAGIIRPQDREFVGWPKKWNRTFNMKPAEKNKKSQSCLTIHVFTLLVRFAWVYLNESKTVDPNPKALHFQRHSHFQPNSDGFGRRCPVWTWPCLPVWEFYGIRGLYFVPWYLWSCFLEKSTLQWNVGICRTGCFPICSNVFICRGVSKMPCFHM